jgi:hypothetical protein
MYNRLRPHLYYGGENLKYNLTSSPIDFLTRGAALRTNSIGPHPLHKGVGWGGGVEGGEGSLHNLIMSMTVQPADSDANVYYDHYSCITTTFVR